MKLAISTVLALSSLSFAGESSPTLRVMSWNLHHGAGMDGKIELSRIASIIKKERPDVVLLQEVDNQTSRSAKVDQAAELAKLTGMHGVFGKAMAYAGGGYGQAILTKIETTANIVHPLPSSAEPRIAFEATVTIHGTAIKVITAHLDLNAEKRLAQATELNRLFADTTQPIILGGDFNATPGSPAITQLANHWHATEKSAPTLTSPADHPIEEIDHFFIKGCTLTSPVTVLPEAMASDHRPLIGVFQLVAKHQ